MHVHLCLANHGPIGRETLLDQTLWVVSGLEQNGHSVTVSDTSLDPDSLNIFWEYFPPSLGRYLAENQFAYGIIGTEIPDGSGFNSRRDNDWPDRWRGFRLAASQAKFIWALVDGAVEDYRRFSPTAYLELGFTERLVPTEPRATPTFDFSFAGVPRTHRQGIIDRLSAQASVHHANGLLSHGDQLDLLRQGRVALALKQSPDWLWSSPTRVGRLVHERIPVAHEWVAHDIGVSKLIAKPTEQEDFVEWALARLETDLEAEAEAAFEAYQAIPMRECIARAMDLTL